MKKIKLFLASLLAIVTLLVTCVGCSLFGLKGVYKPTEFDPVLFDEIDLDPTKYNSYVEFESGKKIHVFISLDLPLVAPIEIQGRGTYEEEKDAYPKGEGKKKYKVTLEDGKTFYFTKDDEEIEFDCKIGILTLEKMKK